MNVVKFGWLAGLLAEAVNFNLILFFNFRHKNVLDD